MFIRLGPVSQQRGANRKGVEHTSPLISFSFFVGNRLPFSLRFLSDHYEFAGAMAEINKPGFQKKLPLFLKENIFVGSRKTS